MLVWDFQPCIQWLEPGDEQVDLSIVNAFYEHMVSQPRDARRDETQEEVNEGWIDYDNRQAEPFIGPQLDYFRQIEEAGTPERALFRQDTSIAPMFTPSDDLTSVADVSLFDRYW